MNKVVRRVGKLALTSASLIRNPLYVRPGHFYSPITGAQDIARARSMRAKLVGLDGLDLHPEAQLKLAETLAPRWHDVDTSTGRYRADNRMYGMADGAVYFSILEHVRPRRIIEVGSGYSSALALDFRDTHLPALEMTFVEPYPQRLLGLLSTKDQAAVRLHRKPVQDIPLETYDQLADGDILFIDSTHVAKAGSDVNWLIFQVLPRLKPGVLVHLHDIFYPFEYPDEWLAQGRSWNESYVLRAFLTYNETFEIMLFNSWLWNAHNDLITSYLPTAANDAPGSIWLRRTS